MAIRSHFKLGLVLTINFGFGEVSVDCNIIIVCTSAVAAAADGCQAPPPSYQPDLDDSFASDAGFSYFTSLFCPSLVYIMFGFWSTSYIPCIQKSITPFNLTNITFPQYDNILYIILLRSSPSLLSFVIKFIILLFFFLFFFSYNFKGCLKATVHLRMRYRSVYVYCGWKVTNRVRQL